MLSVKLETYYLLHSSPSCSWSAVWLVAAGKHFQWWEMRIEWNKTSLTAYFPTVWVFFCKTLIFCVILVESSFSLPAFTFCILHILHTTFRCRRDTFLSMCLSCTSIFPLSSYLLPSVQFDFLVLYLILYHLFVYLSPFTLLVLQSNSDHIFFFKDASPPGGTDLMWWNVPNNPFKAVNLRLNFNPPHYDLLLTQHVFGSSWFTNYRLRSNNNQNVFPHEVDSGSKKDNQHDKSY